MTADRLSWRALNRATLERQLLLDRSDRSVLDAVTHLVGLQAQVPLNPYLALWSRLAGFQPGELGRLMIDRAVVRIVVMRGTIHLVTAADCLILRPLAQPVLDAELARHPEYGPPLVGVDLEPVLAFARELTTEQPRTGPQLRQAMQHRFPDLDPGALAYACRNHLAFVQVPPRGVWGQSGAVTSTTAEAWLGRPVAANPSIDDVIIRYLGAFGPATPADAAAWSRLTGMREVFDRLRPQLRVFRDERDRELFDLPMRRARILIGPLPPRFLPEYDNALLSHADRSRFTLGQDTGPLFSVERPIHGTVLVDGAVGATWRLDHDPRAATAALTVDHVGTMTKRTTAAVTAEARRMLRFQHPDATTRDVHFNRLD